MVADQYRLLAQRNPPALAKHGIRILDITKLKKEDRAWVEEFYRSKVRPVLTPLAIDPGASVSASAQQVAQPAWCGWRCREWRAAPHLAVVQVPVACCRAWSRLPRNDDQRDYVFLETLIGHFLREFFRGTDIEGYWPFRVTRNSELYIDEDEAPNLLKAVEKNCTTAAGATRCGWRSRKIAPKTFRDAAAPHLAARAEARRLQGGRPAESRRG